MNFHDTGIIISKKSFKENSHIISVFTHKHGLYSAVISRIAKKAQSLYTPGNLVDFFWQARLIDHLGMGKCELIKSYSSYFITDKIKLYSFNSIVSLIKVAFHEREPHNNFFPSFKNYLEHMKQPFDFREYIKLELQILTNSGYGLILDKCAVTGKDEDLYFVSPKSGKAVSFEQGMPYKDKLLKLPQILLNTKLEITPSAIMESFALTTYFFNRYFFHNKPLPYERQIFTEVCSSQFSN